MEITKESVAEMADGPKYDNHQNRVISTGETITEFLMESRFLNGKACAKVKINRKVRFIPIEDIRFYHEDF